MIKKNICFFCLWFFSIKTYSMTLDDVQQRFKDKSDVRASFIQERYLRDMQRPLLSSGTFLISQHLGVWWHQEKPFQMTTILTNEEIVQILKGQIPQVITMQGSPQLFQFNALLKALFNADKKVLQKNFKVYFVNQSDSVWRISLIPMESPLDKLFEKIELIGAVYLEQIEIYDRQGDRTKITFSGMIEGALTDDERANFAY